MRTVRVTMSDQAFSELSARAKTKGLPGIASLLLAEAKVLSDDAEAADIKKRAIQKIKKMAAGTKFRLKDLFQPEVWENFSKGSRIRAGRQFYEAAKLGVEGIAILPKSSSNHQYYVRVV